MLWLNLNIPSAFRSPAWVGATPTQRATWIAMLAWCCEQENGGTIDATGWGDRRWQQSCGVTLAEVEDAAPGLWRVENKRVIVDGYPARHVESRLAAVEKARAAAAARWSRKKSTPPAPQPDPAEQDITTPAQATGAPTTDEQRWPIVQSERPELAALKRSGAKVGAGNWTAWARLVEAHGIDAVLAAVAATPPARRWPDAAEERLNAGVAQQPKGNRRKTLEVSL